MPVESQLETRSFEAEVKQLLRLVADSLYSSKDIFLRELISNASDAADKLRYAALSDSALYEDQPELKVTVDFDETARTVTVRDNGIGMTRDDVIEHLGTIAKSGTRAFRDLLEAGKEKDSQLIGQFGVGFYSVFIVSDKVTVKSRRAGMTSDQGVVWESAGDGEYTVKNIEKADRGTEIILHLKEGEDEFLDPVRLRGIITQYSDHIVLPVEMKTVDLPNADSESSEKDSEPKMEVVNKAKALWTLSKSEIKDEDYQALYKHITHDFQDPLAWAHNRVEGKSEYISLLYIPTQAPFDLFNRDQQRGLKLYVKRVFIMDDVEQFMPLYMRFVKGIVDSSDLPLNVSREILQSNDAIEKIKSGCVKRVLSLLENLAENDPEKYETFWNAFGQVLKEGPAEDFANRDRIAPLLRFASTHTDQDKQNVSLKDYISRMPENQDKIYYLTSDSFTAAKNSPLLEVFRKKGIEVLLLSDRVDEWLVAHLTEFDGKALVSVAKGDLDLGGLEDNDAKEEKKQSEEAFTDALKRFKDALGGRVKEVRLTHRLTDSPACVVFDENELSGHMQRLMASAGQSVPETPPILELNPKHRLVTHIKEEQNTERFGRWSDILLGQALLAEGEQLKDPAAFVKGLNELLLDVSK